MLRIELGGAPAHTFYEFVKDFQPLMAALVALCAAGVAFYSARIQRRTARELAEHQARITATKERESLERQKSAMIIKILAVLDALIDQVNELAIFLNHYLDEPSHLPESSLDLLWETFKAQPSLKDGYTLFNFNLDLSILHTDDQYAIFRLSALINDVSEGTELAKKHRSSRVSITAACSLLQKCKEMAIEVKDQLLGSLGMRLDTSMSQTIGRTPPRRDEPLPPH